MQETTLLKTGLAMLLSTAVIPGVAIAEDFDTSWYLGAGAGYSTLDPDTGGSAFSTTDDNDSGYKITLGYDFNEAVSAEIFYTDLGTAKMQGGAITGDADISAYGASVLWYFWHQDENYNTRKGWQSYVSAGLASIDEDSSFGLQDDSDSQLTYGIAAEYGWDNGLAVRVGADAYSNDATMVSINLVKRFGTGSSSKTQSSPVIDSRPAPVAVEPVVTTPPDSDKDGVTDDMDKCANSSTDKPVDADGCTIVRVVLENVNFESGSSELAPSSSASLDKAADALNEYPHLRMEIQAYTDNMGPASFNLYLSEQRANSVRTYLINKGIAADRLVAKGYGEAQPIADNSSREGRAKNRRVELKIIE
jgi:OOP family OmpA-OmpF porin